METVFYFLDGWSIAVPGNYLQWWEEVRDGRRVALIVRHNVNSLIDAGSAYRVELRSRVGR